MTASPALTAWCHVDERIQPIVSHSFMRVLHDNANMVAVTLKCGHGRNIVMSDATLEASDTAALQRIRQ